VRGGLRSHHRGRRLPKSQSKTYGEKNAERRNKKKKDMACPRINDAFDEGGGGRRCIMRRKNKKMGASSSSTSWSRTQRTSPRERRVEGGVSIRGPLKKKGEVQT